MAMKGNIQTIELDCPPFTPRPDAYIRGVIEGLGIEPVTYDVTPFFGCAEYVFKIDEETWVTKYQPTIKARIEALYNSGVIRYGSW